MKPVEVRGGNELHQVAVSYLVLHQEREMIRRVALVRRPIFYHARRHVGFATDDRFDARLFRFLIKFDRAVEIAMIGDGDGRHPEFLRLFHQLPHPHRAIEEGVFGVKMEVDEGIGRHPLAL